MTSHDWARMQEVFDIAADAPPADRDRILAEHCRGDAELRDRVLGLLAELEADGDFLERPLVPNFSAAEADDEPGTPVGSYRLLRRLGTGGMGAVFEAERVDGDFEHHVAIKLIRHGLNGDAIVRRFRREGQILASLDHPNIARLLDGGRAEDGRPYLVMELADGLPIDRYCARRSLPLDARLRLFLEACEAVRYAHARLVVHRDLKPGNVLVTAAGRVKLLDFGVAKLLRDEDAPVAGTLTGLGIHPLTPDYASPEQLRGDPITTAADIYALGVILYELLTGRRPFHLDRPTPVAIARVLETEPAKPSTAVTGEAAAHAGEASLAKLRRRLAGDLDDIVLMALRKEPERRYRSVEQFADDVRRYIDGLPVLARGDSASYRARKFVRRHRVGVLAAAAVFLALVGGVAAASWQARAAERERVRAERISGFLQRMLAAGDASWYNPGPLRGPRVTVLELLDAAARQADHELAAHPDVAVEVRRTIGNAYRSLSRYEEAEAQLEAALALERRRRGGPRAREAHLLADLGAARLAVADLEGAEARYREGLALYRRLGIEADSSAIATLSGLGLTYHVRGELGAAEAHFEQALALSRRAFGESHALVALNLGYLGLVRDLQGDADGSERYYRESLATFERLGDREYVERMSVLTSLAVLLMGREQYAAADSLLRESIAGLRRTVGEEHHHTGMNWTHLANVQYLAGDPAAAAATVQRALGILERVLPVDHLDVAYARVTYGMTLSSLGRHGEAEPHLREALRIRRALLVPEHWVIANTTSLLGEALAGQGRYGEAEPLLVQSFAELRGARGETHPRTLAAAGRLVDFYAAIADTARAETYRRFIREASTGTESRGS